jgi:hypothetical protein
MWKNAAFGKWNFSMERSIHECIPDTYNARETMGLEVDGSCHCGGGVFGCCGFRRMGPVYIFKLTVGTPTGTLRLQIAGVSTFGTTWICGTLNEVNDVCLCNMSQI